MPCGDLVKLRLAALDTEQRFAVGGMAGDKLPCLPIQAHALARQIGFATLVARDDVNDALCADVDAAAVGTVCRGEIEREPAVLRLDANDMGCGGAGG